MTFTNRGVFDHSFRFLTRSAMVGVDGFLLDTGGTTTTLSSLNTGSLHRGHVKRGLEVACHMSFIQFL